MLTKPIEDLSLEEINEELEFIGSEKKYSRIDHARNALQKAIERGQVKTANEDQQPEEKAPATRVTIPNSWEPKLGWFESPWEGRKVFVPKGEAKIVREARENGENEKETHFEVELKSGEVKVYAKKSVRFKAVDESYRDHYVHDTSVRTESGAISIHCGDGLAEKLKGLTQLELERVADENGLKEKFEGWIADGKKPGMVRMNLGNMLRPRIRRGEKVTIFGQEV